MHISNSDSSGKRTFVVTLRTDADGAIRRLRNLLKTALRRDRLRCVSAVEQKSKSNTQQEDKS
jgi:hypothetical protein